MHLARHGRGAGPVASAYLAKVHPVFMLPPVAAAAFGAILAGAVDPAAATVHVLAIFGSVYTAHLKDSYIDFHVRGEDDDSPLTATGAWVGIGVCAAAVAVALAGLYLLVDGWAVALTLPGWLIGYLHAPQLDTNPFTATAGYPVGIGLAILGGHYVQVQALTLEAVVLAVVFVVLLSGVKIVDDLQDLAWDRDFGKRSAGVVLGYTSAHRLAVGLMASALAAVVVLSALAVIEPTSALAAAAFAPVLLVARRSDVEVGTMLLIRGSYLFLAALVAAAWWRPLG